VAAPGSGLVGMQFVAHAVEPLLAVTQSMPVNALFLEKGNADLVAPKDIEELVCFGFLDTCRQAPELKESAA